MAWVLRMHARCEARLFREQTKVLFQLPQAMGCWPLKVQVLSVDHNGPSRSLENEGRIVHVNRLNKTNYFPFSCLLVVFIMQNIRFVRTSVWASQHSENRSEYQCKRANMGRISLNISMRETTQRESVRMSLRERQHSENQSEHQYERDNIGRISLNISMSEPT